MSDPTKIARKWLQAMNEHDVGKMSSLCWEDAVGEEIAEPHIAENREQIAESYRELFVAFPDCSAEILNSFSGKGQILIEVRWKGTNKNSFRGTPATGKVVDIKIAYIFKIVEGKIKKITEYYDGATVARQMGL
jgi:steroid delta-isomerase-like uncharacterized protein